MQNSTDPSNDGAAPSASEHADSLGVARPTVERWEKDRKEINPKNFGMVPTAEEHADILTELCEELPLNNATNKNVN